MAARVAVIVAAIAAVVIAAVATTGGGGEDGGGADVPKDAVRVTFVLSPEKEELLRPLVRAFNESGATAGGKPVRVLGQVVASGEAQAEIARGRLKPVVWSPASSFWGRLLNLATDRELVADDNPSLVRTPLVIAMWEQLAKAYGYPGKSLSYADLTKLATEGWAAVGRPEFGRFKYVHTNPDFSTSGLSAVAASYYATAGKKEGLTIADVRSDAVRGKVRALEQSIVHYGDTTLFIADEMRKGGPGYASAVAMEEATLLDFNRRARSGQKLVAVYPQEGTFFSDNPLITLDADWVTAAQRDGARQFVKFLGDRVDPELAARFGFRPADEATAPGARISAANGVDPKQPARVLRVPEARVLDAIRNAWRQDRKPARVMLVIDNSGSMGEENKMELAKDGLQLFLREVSDRDAVGLTRFSTDIEPLVPIAPMSENRARLRDAVAALFPDDETRVHDATVEAVRAVRRDFDEERINAVVVLTDGQDTASSRTQDQVVRELEAEGRREGARVRVFTIAYGQEADEKVLARFAAATGGKAFVASTDDVESVYRSISSFF